MVPCEVKTGAVVPCEVKALVRLGLWYLAMLRLW